MNRIMIFLFYNIILSSRAWETLHLNLRGGALLLNKILIKLNKLTILSVEGSYFREEYELEYNCNIYELIGLKIV